MYQENVYLDHLISNGFRGFVNKANITTELFDTIEAVSNNKFVFPYRMSLKNDYPENS